MSAVPTQVQSPTVAHMRAVFHALPAYVGALGELKRRALDKFIARGFPTARQEEWRYTNLRRFESRNFSTAPVPSLEVAADELRKLDKLSGVSRIVFVDGQYTVELSQLPTLPGIAVTPLSMLMRDKPARAAAALSALELDQADPFSLLNLALTQDGVFIDVQPETQASEALHLVFLWTTSSAQPMCHPRVVIHAGEHSNVGVVEHYLAANVGEQFTNAVTTVQLDSGSRVEHCRIQEEAAASFHIGSLHAQIDRDAHFVSHHFALGANLARLGVSVNLMGPGAEVELNGLQFASATQHLDTHTQVDHVVPHTRSTEDYRGIADGRGRVVFNGKVFVHAKAIKTDAQQSSRNLLLSPAAEIDTKPELEIYADDVKCAHGATVGQLDNTALFYLRSRGLTLEEARALLTVAFAEAVVSRVSASTLRDYLGEAVHRRFRPSENAS